MAGLTDILSQNERLRRLRILDRFIKVLGSGILIVIALLVVFGGGINDRNLYGILANVSLVICLTMAWVCVRAHRIEPATHLVFGSIVFTVVATSISRSLSGAPIGTSGLTIFGLFIPVVGATLFLRPRWSFVYAELGLLAYDVVYLTVGSSTGDKSTGNLILRTIVVGLYFGLMALLSYLAARGYEGLLQERVAQAQALDQTRAQLAQQVDAQTGEIRQAMIELERSTETIRQMSVPVVRIADGVVVLPLVGSLDQRRAALLEEQLLAAVYRMHCRVVLIEITGVPVVDEVIATALLHTAQGVRLLGAEVVLVGVRAEVAQTMVQLGLDMRQLVVRRDLASGLEYALADAGKQYAA